MGDLLPCWPAERKFARFAEQNTGWDEAEALMETRIAERTKKYKWLVSRDIANRANLDKKRLRGKKAETQASGSGNVEEAGDIITTNKETPAGRSLQLKSPADTILPSAEAESPNLTVDADLAGETPNIEAVREMAQSLNLESPVSSSPNEAQSDTDAGSLSKKVWARAREKKSWRRKGRLKLKQVSQGQGRLANH